MNDRLFRVVIPDPELLGILKETVAEFVYDSDALLGFQMSEGGGGMWSLVSGRAEVLARSRDKYEVFSSLLHFICEMAAPPPPEGAVRLAMRALRRVDGGQATLFGPDAHVFGTLVERRLQRVGLAAVDARFVDVQLAGHEATPTSVNGQLTRLEPHGTDVSPSAAHVAPSPLSLDCIERVIVPRHMWGDGVDLSLAQFATSIAVSATWGTRRQRLDVAGRLAVTTPSLIAGVGDDLYAAAPDGHIVGCDDS